MGEVTLVPSAPPGYSFVGLQASHGSTVAQLVPDCLVEPAVYCESKVNSLGCKPQIALSSAPSASAGSGCTLSASQLLAQKPGLFFHSSIGSDFLPFHGGYLCTMKPNKRHAATSTGSIAGTCNGVLSEDLNAYIASGADPTLTPGATLWIQAWSRDPGDPFGDSLSNAVSAVVCP